MNIFWVVLITLLPAVGWGVLWWSQDSEKEPFRSMLLCFVLGALVTIPFVLWKVYLVDVMAGMSDALGLFFSAFLEEIAKVLVLILGIELTRHWFTQIVDGLVYGAAVALGFAFAENIVYLTDLPTLDVTFVLVYLVRSLNTMVGHSLFTALFGFFYASAYLRKEVFPEKKKEKPWAHFLKNIREVLPLHVTFSHILPNRPSKHGHYPGSLILEGILVAGLLHGLFNMMLTQPIMGYELGFLTYPLLFGLAYLIWRMFLQGVYTKMVMKVKRA